LYYRQIQIKIIRKLHSICMRSEASTEISDILALNQEMSRLPVAASQSHYLFPAGQTSISYMAQCGNDYEEFENKVSCISYQISEIRIRAWLRSKAPVG
jgi:hypothetical protein